MYPFVKRFFDIVGAGLGLIALSLFLLIVSVQITPS